MADTIKRSLESMLQYTNDKFEILVVDDGSLDESPQIVSTMQEKYSNIRLIRLKRDSNRKLGVTRNISVREAKGEYVLLQMDMDDEYSEGILDFVEIFHQLEKKLEKNFYLKGNSINIGKRSFLLEQGPYRNIWRGEDKDLWRRLVLQDKIVWLVHKPFWKRMREKRNFQQTTRMLFDAWVNDFRTGVMLKGYIIHLAHTKKIKNPLFWYACIACPIAWFFASYKGFLDRDRKPIQYYLKKIKKVQNRLVELEQKYHFNIDKTKLSKKGLIIFYDK